MSDKISNVTKKMHCNFYSELEKGDYPRILTKVIYVCSDERSGSVNPFYTMNVYNLYNNQY